MTLIPTILLSFPTIIFLMFLDWTGYGTPVVFRAHEFCVSDFLIGYFVCAVYNWYICRLKERDGWAFRDND